MGFAWFIAVYNKVYNKEKMDADKKVIYRKTILAWMPCFRGNCVTAIKFM